MEPINMEPYMRTILDYLNEDCWRTLLQYVPVRDIILSERVSRQWQSNMLAYLRDVHIGIGSNPHMKGTRQVHWLQLKKDYCLSFKSWTEKLGASVVACANCSEETIKIVIENCPNLKTVMVSFLNNLKLSSQNEYLRKLQQLHFNTCCYVSDNFISQFITGDTLEELDFVWCSQMTGQCLTSLKPARLKSLGFKYCQSLTIRDLLPAADRLSELTNLELAAFDTEIAEQLHLLLDKLTKLEHLVFESDYIRCDDFLNSVCSLSNLKSLAVNYQVTDAILEDVIRSCQKLENLDLGNCSAVTGRGLAAACAQAGARLAALGVRGSTQLTDHDVGACVRACPNLQSLDVSRSPLLTPAAAARAAAARRELRAQGVRHTLLLDLSECEHCYDCHLMPQRDQYKEDGLMLTF